MDNHIQVTLDFMPVEEAMPRRGVCAFSEVVLVLYFNGHDIALAQYDTDGCVWEYADAEVSSPIQGVTHWAYIPQIKEAT